MVYGIGGAREMKDERLRPEEIEKAWRRQTDAGSQICSSEQME